MKTIQIEIPDDLLKEVEEYAEIHHGGNLSLMICTVLKRRLVRTEDDEPE